MLLVTIIARQLRVLSALPALQQRQGTVLARLAHVYVLLRLVDLLQVHVLAIALIAGAAARHLRVLEVPVLAASLLRTCRLLADASVRIERAELLEDVLRYQRLLLDLQIDDLLLFLRQQLPASPLHHEVLPVIWIVKVLVFQLLAVGEGCIDVRVSPLEPVPAFEGGLYDVLGSGAREEDGPHGEIPVVGQPPYSVGILAHLLQYRVLVLLAILVGQDLLLLFEVEPRRRALPVLAGQALDGVEIQGATVLSLLR